MFIASICFNNHCEDGSAQTLSMEGTIPVDMAEQGDRMMEEDVGRCKEYDLWLDSCIPQNRNRIKSTALLDFLNRHPEIETIIHKFSETGHACIQEKDAAHSSIDEVMKNEQSSLVL
ncbi:hypothetical protein PoB_004823300 [Plakobranchus ocellatus]|uniref:Uncharacterized protein n=1 Tax=Plakobranchus ocellatus TaxID=259542 RepID=A0AAV4BQ74_9GAST|nr:hypothetical protein PoB_004823300 [Plakobranchus ocellatus]